MSSKEAPSLRQGLFFFARIVSQFHKSSQKIRDFIGKTIGFKTATEGLLIFVFAVALIVRIGFAIYTQNPYLLTPEAMPSQVTPEVLQEAPKIHLTV